MRQISLFLREHFSWIIFELFLVLFIIVLYWLDGFSGINTMIYSVIISMLLLCAFLGAKFITRRSYYNAILRKPTRMEDALIRNVRTAEEKRSSEFMRDLYSLHQNEVQTLYASQHRQLNFINQWVHQMKTPISVINLLLQEEGELDKRSVREEVDKIQRGLDAVLVNARLGTFEEDMHIERVGLKTLIQQIVTDHKRLFITNGVFPVISINESLIVATDPKWMKIVIGQFITNAVKYTFGEGKRVYLSATRTKKGFELTIRDEGVGIPKSDLKRVTRAFFTGENGRLTGESTGMGLYIADEVCGKLGHPLAIESEVGKGTEVKILFTNGELGEADAEEYNKEHNLGTEAGNEDL
ncbi:sensor histidine kinase [Sporosarcina highlanderae]|uniref:histidine kinase n=1 Tax=Sporosarcina highlanderae TaxID=3035916 RepID=A0ABT8JP92_9BACL|nr:sensor histidine kinase [Sporosarcina highlanderae]MDN4606772.1 sensor histidine kinase [Sporosarcina highlanderae]